LLSILYGIGAALGWGAGDFAGGLAARKLGAYRAVFWGDLIGLLIILPVALASGDRVPSVTAIRNALIGGMLGSIGLLVLYYSMSIGQMSIAAPVSALFAALLPVLVGIFTQGLPSLQQFLGFGFALTAVWWISQGNTTERFHLRQLTDLRLPILAGLGFGSYFTFLHYASAGSASISWTMTFSRIAGTLLLFIMVLVRHDPLPIQRDAWLAVFFNATLDLAGNLFFILASQSGGRLDVSAVLSSLFPGSTVLLAWLFLNERLAPRQWLGIGMALLAIVCFTI
jgi:drug/metabolite transporter (DMT)-like permease